jgi:ABC-type transport system involved in multi-copper enzyme maturation permease subunit
MIWMTWRQFRAQAATAFAALVVLTAYLVILGLQIRSTYNGDLAQCHASGGCAGLLVQFENEYSARLTILSYLLIAVPGLIGIFWGAPLVARELENGTHRLVWNQSVTRGEWLLVKLALVGLLGMAAAGAFSLMLTWAASPFDLVEADRFGTTLFAARNIAPVAYAAFAVVLGTTVGLMVRRTVPAMAITLVLFAVVQVAMPTAIRPHLLAPATTAQQMTTPVTESLTFLGRGGTVGGLKIPDAWIVSTSSLLTSNDRPLGSSPYDQCTSKGSWDATAQCLAALDLHVQVNYQPPDRYWPLQWFEFAIFMALAGLLGGLGFWRIHSRLAT